VSCLTRSNEQLVFKHSSYCLGIDVDSSNFNFNYLHRARQHKDYMLYFVFVFLFYHLHIVIVCLPDVSSMTSSIFLVACIPSYHGSSSAVLERDGGEDGTVRVGPR